MASRALTPLLRRSVVTRTTTALRGGASPPIPPFARLPVPSQKVCFALLSIEEFGILNSLFFLVGGK